MYPEQEKKLLSVKNEKNFEKFYEKLYKSILKLPSENFQNQDNIVNLKKKSKDNNCCIIS